MYHCKRSILGFSELVSYALQIPTASCSPTATYVRMASGGVPEIKKLWQHGEELSLDGKHSEAILHFQRAKSMLLVESKALYGATEIPQDGGGGSKLMGDILTKLSESINRDVKLINANAVHALGLKRGFNKADVKKAYRSAALKYHPDKNKDCDTSCIFAAIQSGYSLMRP